MLLLLLKLMGVSSHLLLLIDSAIWIILHFIGVVILFLYLAVILHKHSKDMAQHLTKHSVV